MNLNFLSVKDLLNYEFGHFDWLCGVWVSEKENQNKKEKVDFIPEFTRKKWVSEFHKWIRFKPEEKQERYWWYKSATPVDL